MSTLGLSRQPSLAFSDFGSDDDVHIDINGGDYSTRMGELFDDEDHTPTASFPRFGVDQDDDDEEAFVYDGADVHVSRATYREQLRDVLDGDDNDDEVEECEVERSLVHGLDHPPIPIGDEALPSTTTGTLSPSSTSVSLSSPPSMSSSLLPNGAAPPALLTQTAAAAKFSPSFLHPNISRLRSYMPHASPTPSATATATSASSALRGISPSPVPSSFSTLSPGSSSSAHLPALPIPDGAEKYDFANGHGHDRPSDVREVFRWTQLRALGTHLFARNPSNKAQAVLGAPAVGAPTVMTANGFICIGTESGRILVFDFKQTLRCICGDPASEKTVGAVTALALSHDHTFVAAGHTTGHIQLFDLSKPHVPARSVPPTTLAAVASGRKEGHLQGARIVNIGFVAGRHTAVVSADHTGLAFYHSLGKALFFEASDVLRILGKYPNEEPIAMSVPEHPPVHRRRGRRTNTILAMAPLPLGTLSHPTDAYNVTALLTAAKLVIVGLKPSPKTWYRKHRDEDDEPPTGGKAKFRAALAWFPSVVVVPSDVSASVDHAKLPGKKEKGGSAKNTKRDTPQQPTTPMLAYSWGSTLHLLLVSELKTRENITNQRTGKPTTVEIGRLVFEEKVRWRARDVVHAVQWLNAKQILAVTASAFEVYDVQTRVLVEHAPFDPSSLVSPTIAHTINGAFSYLDATGDIAHSVRTYKGKIFLLGRREVQVGTLLTWADRILSSVENGDFLSAIELTRSYYLGTAPGNKNGLPGDPLELKKVVGEKMRELMVASTRYAFSEDRMTDGTHNSPDGRGVDRTSLFENLVATCARACIALGNLEFLFEDLFQAYDDAGIAPIYLEQFETFVLEHDVRTVDPRIAQRLIGLHAANGRPDCAERVIWHINPACLDIDQVVQLCQAHNLYDALIYVYTRAMRDYVAPVVEMLGLIRKVMQLRRSPVPDETALEPVIVNAYKVYPYLADVLSGLTYPSEEPLDQDEATEAKQDLYSFLFHGRSCTWPRGDGGKLILTAEEDGGVEPTYPYCRLLLRFDAEAFLHALDLAFEDTYFIDEASGSTSRLVIVKILLEILASSSSSAFSSSTSSSSGGLPPAVRTFVHIFVARNVPKYPQSIQMAPSVLHGILVGLTTDADWSTREDRQLAAEYLLSAYTPHETEQLQRLFEDAGFYRILRTWHRQEGHWAPLFLAYLHDPDVHAAELFARADEIFTAATAQLHSRAAPSDDDDLLRDTIATSLPDLLNASVIDTARLLNRHAPQLHEQAIDSMMMASSDDADHKCFAYLRCLLGPPSEEDEPEQQPQQYQARSGPGPSAGVSPRLRQLYVALLCKVDPASVIPSLRYLPPDFLEWDDALRTCEDEGVFDAVVWALDWRGSPMGALKKVGAFGTRLSATIGGLVAQGAAAATQASEQHLQRHLECLQAIGRTAVAICVERSSKQAQAQAAAAAEEDVPVEDLWFQLLHTQISTVQAVSACCCPPDLNGSAGAEQHEESLIEHALTTLRSLVQATFSSLVSASAARGRGRGVSFPRLFTRLVETTSTVRTGGMGAGPEGTRYTEFRAILTGMMEAYRAEGDMLVITKHLLDRDVFQTVETAARARARGWTPRAGTCAGCRLPLCTGTGTGNGVVAGAGAGAGTNRSKSKSKGKGKGAMRETMVEVEGDDDEELMKITIMRTGIAYHSSCLPPCSSNGDSTSS
ncbi:Golgi CORVET complex core vacuolar protein 8-domain-containing protein [Russula compacta]|nr:Golgi CORVET complex core vacuolar protein 8-domain-containing protein [Russula compacta]